MSDGNNGTILSRITAFFLVTLCLILGPGLAARPDPGQAAAEESIRLLARHQEKNGPVWLAQGAVELRFGPLILLADRLQVNSETFEVVAEGQVTLQLPSEVVACDRLTYNLKTGEGELQGVRAISRPGLFFGAESIARSPSGHFRLDRAWFTNCTQPVPRWLFSFSEASLHPEEYISMKRAVLRVKKLPLLYVPYLRYPLKDRATGFLFPKVGFNRVKGLTISQSFYWALAPNMDATITADLYARRGTGAGLEYRYLFPGGTKGEINGYLFSSGGKRAVNGPVRPTCCA